MAFKSDAVFAEIKKQMNADACGRVGAVFQFDLTSGGKEKSWVVDAKNAPGSVTEGKSDKADCTIVISDEDYIGLISGTLNGMQAFMQGKMKIKGNMMLAQKLEGLVDPEEAKKAMAKL